MDDHLTMLVDDFDNDNFDQSDSSLPKSEFADVICSVPPTFHSIVRNVTKEVVTVNPIFKIEPEIIAPRIIKQEHSIISRAILEKKKQELLAPSTNLTNIATLNPNNNTSNELKASAIIAPQKRNRGQIDRYNGLTEEEVVQRKLPDYLRSNLDMIVVGINPSMTSASVGHHYAGIGNHFWTCITEAGIVPEPVTCYDDYRMLDYGIGFTNVCSRPTKGAAEISRKEMKAGAAIMLEKMRKYRPKIAVFNGKGIYEAFVGHKNFYMGKQPKPLDGTDITVFVMPSSSARCAQLPRAEDKLPFFVALRKLRDSITGRQPLNLPPPSDHELIFTDYTEFRVTQPDPKSLRKAERRRKRKAEQMLALSSTTGNSTNTNNNTMSSTGTHSSNINSNNINSSTNINNTTNSNSINDGTGSTVAKQLLSRAAISSHSNNSNQVISRKPIIANSSNSNQHNHHNITNRHTAIHHPTLAAKGTLIQPQPQQQHHNQTQHHHQQHQHQQQQQQTYTQTQQQHQISIAPQQSEQYGTITLTTANHDDNNQQSQQQQQTHIEIPLAALFGQQTATLALAGGNQGSFIGIIPSGAEIAAATPQQHFLLTQNGIGGQTFAIATNDYASSVAGALKQAPSQPILVQQADGSHAYLIAAPSATPQGTLLAAAPQAWSTGPHTPTLQHQTGNSEAPTPGSGAPSNNQQQHSPTTSLLAEHPPCSSVESSTGNNSTGTMVALNNSSAVAPQQMLYTTATQFLQQAQPQIQIINPLQTVPACPISIQQPQSSTTHTSTNTNNNTINTTNNHHNNQSNQVVQAVLHQLASPTTTPVVTTQDQSESNNSLESQQQQLSSGQYQLSLSQLTQLLSGGACYTAATPSAAMGGQQFVIPLSATTGGTTYIQLGGANGAEILTEDLKSVVSSQSGTTSYISFNQAVATNNVPTSSTSSNGSIIGCSGNNNNSTNQSANTVTTASSDNLSDLITSTTILATLPESSSSSPSHLYHHHHHHLQLADCEDQLVHCSSSDEKLVYSAL